MRWLFGSSPRPRGNAGGCHSLSWRLWCTSSLWWAVAFSCYEPRQALVPQARRRAIWVAALESAELSLPARAAHVTSVRSSRVALQAPGAVGGVRRDGECSGALLSQATLEGSNRAFSARAARWCALVRPAEARLRARSINGHL